MNRPFGLRVLLVISLAGCQTASTVDTIDVQAPTTLRATTKASTSSSTITSTPTSVPVVSTTTTAPIVCRPDPFTEELAADLAADYPGIGITAHVYDTTTSCEYSLNPANRQATASVFKVMVMAGTLLEAQEAELPVSDDEMRSMTSMITESANDPVRALWRSFGGSPWFSKQGETFGLNETDVRGDDYSAWGLTTTSAHDQVDLLRQVLLGHWGPLDAESREVALELMTSVDDSQTWGVTAGVPVGWVVAQKNGFAGPTINSVGWINEPGPSQGYVVAILTRGWSTHASGIVATERISKAIAAVMTAPNP